MATSHFSLEGIAGYHHFPGKVSPSLNIDQFSASGKLYMTTTGVRPFVRGGVGGHHFDTGGTHFGSNSGVGVLYEWTRRFGLEASYNFHIVNDPTTTKFSTVQLGFRAAF